MLILLPVDGSELALDAVHHVLRLRDEGLAVQVLLANVQEAPHLYEVVLAPDPALLDEASERAGRHALAAAQDLLQQADVEVEVEVAHGDPARVLAELAERHGCDAIVMAAGEPGALSPGRVGPVALAVLHHAAVPVTIVHHAEADESD